MLRSLTLCITSVSGIHEPFLPHIWMLVCTYSSIKDRSRFFVNPCFDCGDRERLSEISCLTLQICIQHLDYIADLMNWYNAVGISCSKFQSCSCWRSKWLLISAVRSCNSKLVGIWAKGKDDHAHYTTTFVNGFMFQPWVYQNNLQQSKTLSLRWWLNAFPHHNFNRYT